MVAANSVLLYTVFHLYRFLKILKSCISCHQLPPQSTVCSGGGYDDKHRRVKNTSSALLDSDNLAMIFPGVIFYAQKLFLYNMPHRPYLGEGFYYDDVEGAPPNILYGTFDAGKETETWKIIF